MIKYLKIKHTVYSIIKQPTHYITMTHFKQNTRFDCLKSSTRPNEGITYHRNDNNNRREFSGGDRREFSGGDRREFSGGDRREFSGGNRSRRFSDKDKYNSEPKSESTLFSLNDNSFGKYLNIPGVEKTENVYVTPAQRNKNRYTFLRQDSNTDSYHKKKTVDAGTRFPTLPNLKKSITNNKGNIIDYTNVKNADTIIKKEEKKPATFETLPDGWVKLSKKSQSPEKIEGENEESDNSYNHNDFNYECGVACLNTMQQIQQYRDEHIEVFNATSPYYDKTSLMDLNYISDSDVEYSDSDEDNCRESEQEYGDDDY